MSRSLKLLAKSNRAVPVFPSSGLISYWRCDEVGAVTNADVLGSNNLTTVTNASHTSGKIGNCAFATGAGPPAFSCADNPSQTPAGAFSVAGWILVYSLSGAQYHTVLSKCDFAANNSFAVLYSNAGYWQFVVTSDGSSFVGSSIADTPTLGQWYFMAAVYDGAHTKLSINDGAVTSAVFTGSIYDGNAPLSILGTGSQNAGCLVDEVGFWGRALTPSEITDLYNGGDGLSHP